MGHVSEYIREMVVKQVKDNHLVVWFDPERIYGDISADLEIPGGTVARYRDSFFELRHDIAPLMTREEPPDLLIYVPLSEEETENALVAYTSAGIVLKPHQTPWQRNTRLAVIANQALKDLVDDAAELEEIVKKVDRNELTLSDLDALAERARKSSYQKILALIYRVETPQDITLSFLNRPETDEELTRKNALDDLKTFLHTEYGAEIREDTPETCRGELARYVLMSALLANLDNYVPEMLSRVPHARSTKDQQACAQLVYEWQMRRDLQKSYATWARKIEQALGIGEYRLELSQIEDIHTFQGIDQAVLSLVEQALLTQSTDDLEEIARKREQGFWAEMVPTTKARWRLVATIAAFLQPRPGNRDHDERAKLHCRRDCGALYGQGSALVPAGYTLSLRGKVLRNHRVRIGITAKNSKKSLYKGPATLYGTWRRDRLQIRPATRPITVRPPGLPPPDRNYLRVRSTCHGTGQGRIHPRGCLPL